MVTILLLFPLLALAQSGGGVSNTPPLIGNKGTSLPAACTVGQLFFKSDATAGQNIYECAAANTWTQQLNSGGGGGSPGGSSGNLQTNNGSGGFGAYAGATCASGAATAISASGALTCGSGTIVVPSTVSTTPTTISSGTIAQIRAFDVDTSGAATTINLPATPVDGELIYIKKKTTDNNLLTIGRNAKNIDGAASNLTTNAANKPVYALQWSATDSTWYQVAISPSGTVVSTQSSTTYALAGTDSGLTVQYTGAGAGSLTIPAATTFGTTYTFNLENRESGASAGATLTPATSTIDGASSVVIPYGMGLFGNSDGANYTSGKYSWKYFPLDTGSTQTVTGQKTFVAPILGAATGTSFNGLTITSSTGTLTVPNGVVLTGPASSGTAMTLGNVEAVTGSKTFTLPTITGYAFASLPAASSNTGLFARVTDLGSNSQGTLWMSDGTDWRPLNGQARIFQSGIPMGIPGSGSFANNGALTLGTPLGRTWATGMYMYFEANKICTSGQAAAGLYWVVMSSATLGTVYQNTYTSGVPTAPSSPTAWVCTGPGAYTTTISTRRQLYNITLPGNSLTIDGAFLTKASTEQTGTTNSKEFDVRLGTTIVFQITDVSATNLVTWKTATTRNITTRSQQQTPYFTNDAGGSTSVSNPITAVNTGTDQTLNISISLATATDNYFVDAIEWVIQE